MAFFMTTQAIAIGGDVPFACKPGALVNVGEAQAAIWLEANVLRPLDESERTNLTPRGRESAIVQLPQPAEVAPATIRKKKKKATKKKATRPPARTTDDD